MIRRHNLSNGRTVVDCPPIAQGGCDVLAPPLTADGIWDWPKLLVHCLAPMSSFTPYPMAFNASACSLSARRSSRSICRVLPLSGLRATFALPSADFGPVDFSHGFHR